MGAEGLVQYKLTMSQREVLEALIKLYEQKKRLIKSKEIADLIHRDEGTVRNIILSLKSLGLIESKTGPRGGYMPTLKAYEVIRGSMTQIPVKLRKDGQELDLTITGIEILDILNPEGGRAILRVHGVIRKLLKPGDRVEIGPTPLVGVRIEGTVTHIDPVSSQISVKINRMVSVPRVHVGEIAARNPFTVTPDTDIRQLAYELTKRRIRGAPVVEDGRIVGVITLSDIAKALAEGKTGGSVREYMSTPPIVIREIDDIVTAIEMMNRHGIGRLPVIDSAGKLTGIVTRTDILRFIAGLK
jgi:predicted transcriptional regulator